MSGFFQPPEPSKNAEPPAVPSKPARERDSSGTYMDRMIAAHRRRIAPITQGSPSGRYALKARWDVG